MKLAHAFISSKLDYRIKRVEEGLLEEMQLARIVCSAKRTGVMVQRNICLGMMCQIISYKINIIVGFFSL